jgi:hypothetical protein
MSYRAVPGASQLPAPVTETSLTIFDSLMNCARGDSGYIADFERIVGLCFSDNAQTLYCAYKVPGTEKQVKAYLWSTKDGVKITGKIIRDEVC